MRRENPCKEAIVQGMERVPPTPQAAFGEVVGHNTHTGTMILALATRHRVERPAISMGGGTYKSYGAALPAAVWDAVDKYVKSGVRTAQRCGFCRIRYRMILGNLYIMDV